MEKVKEITAKAKEALSGGSHSSDSHPTTKPSTHEGPHSSGLANQADPRVDSDRDGSRNVGVTGGTTGTTGHTSTTGTHGTGHHSAHTGPHSSGLANQADPRVDSDLDGSRNTGLQGGVGTTGHSAGYNQSSTTAGPHSSNLANKLDPRVDSDLDGSRNTGLQGGVGSTGQTTGYNTQSSTTAGPHSSNLANKLDPRVDSDRDGSRNVGLQGGVGSTGQTGYGQTGYGETGYAGGATDNTGIRTDKRHPGPHSSGLANQADPRVDSDLDNSRNAGFASGTTGTHGHTGLTGTTGTTGGVGEYGNTTGHHTAHTGAHTGTHHQAHTAGQTQNTAGPHNSDILNKLDPRVDSDLDGSRNMGAARNPGVADASKHTPSEFAKIGGHGNPEVAHAGDPSDHRRRHSLNEVDTSGTFDRYGPGHE